MVQTNGNWPFYSLDLNSVLKKLYVFRRGRFLENVTTIMMDMNNHSRTFESFDNENIFLKRIFHSLDNPLVSDEEIKVKTDERQNKAPSVKLKPKAEMEIRLLAELTKFNELWESKTSRATLLMNSINKLFLIQYLLFDLLDEKKQKLRERPPMKAVKKRLDNVVSKTKANWMESCAKRAHQVRVRGTHMLKHFFVTKFHNSLIFDKVKEILPPNVKEEIETATEVSDTEQTEILSEEFVPQQLEEETELPVSSDPHFVCDRTIESEILDEDSIENETGEPELDLFTKIQTTKFELPNWGAYFKKGPMRQLLAMMWIPNHQFFNNTDHIKTVQNSLNNIISNVKTTTTKKEFAQHFLSNYIPLLETAGEMVGKDRIVFPSGLYLANPLGYVATEIITNYKNNMCQHFHEYVFQVFNLVTQKKERMEALTDKTERQELCQRINEVRELIINGEISKINFDDKQVFTNPESHLSILFFNYLFNYFEGKMEKTIYYAEKSDPLYFLSHALYLNRLIEDYCPGVRANNPFPLSKSLIPNHIRFDTAWFHEIFCRDLPYNYNEVRKLIWNSVLKPQAIPESLSYDFKYTSISSDGLSCSLLMMRKDLLDENGNARENVTAVNLASNERYIDSLSEDEIEELNLKSKRIVAVDPNQHDLMYCASLKTDEEEACEKFEVDETKQLIENGMTNACVTEVDLASNGQSIDSSVEKDDCSGEKEIEPKPVTLVRKERLLHCLLRKGEV
ncbi:hypothetical protein GEMRC1_001897 [Eukaryota sp. GEM-RC1]